MSGKTLEPSAKSLPPVIDKTAIQMMVGKKYVAVPFEVPGWGVTVEISILKRFEREEILNSCQRADGSWDNLLQNRMAAAFGLVNPTFTLDELKDYPDSFIDPIAAEVWRMSNEYNTKRTEAETKGEGVPFPKTSGSNIGPQTDSDASPKT